MALITATPTIIVPAITATAFEITGFSVNSQAGIMDVTYVAGNMSSDVPPVFVPLDGTNLNMHIDSPTFAVFLAVEPTLYPSIKAALYSLIQEKLGISGTIV